MTDTRERLEVEYGKPSSAKRKPPSKAKAACALIDACLTAGELELFASEVDGTPCVTIWVSQTDDGHAHRETHTIKGGGFSSFLRRKFWTLNEEPLYGDALTAALAHAEMRALLGGSREIYARVAHVGETVLVDAGDDTWGAYAISADGWQYVSEHEISYVRSRGATAFPVPTQGRDLLTLLTGVLGIEKETALLLAIWAVCAYCSGPYLVLVLHGEQGSGKTTAARALRSLTDPSAVPLRTPPRESRDLVAATRANHVIAYDNLSSLPQWLSDALSSISTGSGYEARQLYTNLDEILVRAKRPILLNGIENVAASADLLDRSLVVTMKPITDEKRRSEAEINADLDFLAGELTGAVFTAVSGALANIETVEQPSWARMVDATRWALAAADALGSTSNSVAQVLRENRARRDEIVLEGSVFANAVIEYAAAHAPWHGTTAELWHAMEDTETGKANAERKDVWPQSVQKVVATLAREMPILRRQGVEWTNSGRRGGVRVKILTYTANAPGEASP